MHPAGAVNQHLPGGLGLTLTLRLPQVAGSELEYNMELHPPVSLRGRERYDPPRRRNQGGTMVCSRT